MKKVIVFLASALLVATPMIAAAAGIVGDCSNCHTMHNSQQGQPVAKIYSGGAAVTSDEPIQNLLKFDCIACHANPGATGPIWTLNGSDIPQVSHTADLSNNLAGGNFAYSTTTDRKGHNVKDLTPADGTNADSFGAPPGFFDASTHGAKFKSDYDGKSGGTVYGAFTCAGARGCHGVRAQLLTAVTTDNGTANVFSFSYRTGIAAISGAHHNSQDGLKNPAQNTRGVEDGAVVAAGYRFIPGLIGLGNATDRWKNVDASSHNEYYGKSGGIGPAPGGEDCYYCHVTGTDRGRMDADSTLAVPNQSMSGFCMTCHGEFHSSGVGADLTDAAGEGSNGTSGAFLRHPSDYVIKASGEYAAYTSYDVTAPVARPDLNTTFSVATDGASVRPGTDMVMCLSCHEAHATQYDYMLRFDYSYDGTGTMQAGTYSAADKPGGCLACHTTKGVLPENR